MVAWRAHTQASSSTGREAAGMQVGLQHRAGARTCCLCASSPSSWDGELLRVPWLPAVFMPELPSAGEVEKGGCWARLPPAVMEGAREGVREGAQESLQALGVVHTGEQIGVRARARGHVCAEFCRAGMQQGRAE